MYNVSLDLENRSVILKKTVSKARTSTQDAIVINEFDTLKKKFLPNTADEYECELVLVDVEKIDELGEKTGEVETVAYSRRKGVENWLMTFEPEEYELG